MNERRNPYYNPESFGVEMIGFEDDNLSYEFDQLAFWATKEGQVYSASDSGCSCPTPFEDYDSATLEELLPKLERVGSLDQALSTFRAWNDKSYGSVFNKEKKTDSGDEDKLRGWIGAHLKP